MGVTESKFKTQEGEPVESVKTGRLKRLNQYFSIDKVDRDPHDDLINRERVDALGQKEDANVSTTFSLPPFLDPSYRSTDIMTKRIMPIGLNVWDYYIDSGESVGSGLSGHVKRIVNKATHVSYAYKHFNTQGFSQKQLNILYNEIDIYMGISHPNVATLVEIFSTTTGFGLVMELCIGRNLVHYRLKNKNEWTEAMTKHLFFQMLLAVHSQHENGVAIRDIKLDNFVVQLNENHEEHLPPAETVKRLRCKLIDFGVSRKVMPGVPMTTRQGTIEYMAPEVFDSIYDTKADMWSLGTCLFALLFAKFPYERTKILNGHVKSLQYGVDREFPEIIDDDAKDLLYSLLHYDPNERLSTKEALNHPWLRSQMSQFEAVYASLLCQDGSPNVSVTRYTSTVRGYFNCHPFVRVLCTCASRYLPPHFRNRFDTMFLALTQGLDRIKLSDKSHSIYDSSSSADEMILTEVKTTGIILKEKENSDRMDDRMSFMINKCALDDEDDGKLIQKPVQVIGWHEFLSAMMLVEKSEEHWECYIQLIVDNMRTGIMNTPKATTIGLAPLTAVTKEEWIGYFKSDILGKDSSVEFDRLLAKGKYTATEDATRLDLLKFLMNERSMVLSMIGSP